MIKFRSTEMGGWETPILGEKFKTIIKIDSALHDCCLYLEDSGNRINPGDTLILPMDFLFPEAVLPKIGPGKKFELVTLTRTIADGEFVEVREVP